MSAQPKCTACNKAIKATEAALYANMADGSREHVHVRCIRVKAAATIEEDAA